MKYYYTVIQYLQYLESTVTTSLAKKTSLKDEHLFLVLVNG